MSADYWLKLFALFALLAVLPPWALLLAAGAIGARLWWRARAERRRLRGVIAKAVIEAEHEQAVEKAPNVVRLKARSGR